MKDKGSKFEDAAWVVLAILSVVGIPLMWMVFVVQAYEDKRWRLFAALMWLGIIVVSMVVYYYTSGPSIPPAPGEGDY